jgi:hypothetical protein
MHARYWLLTLSFGVASVATIPIPDRLTTSGDTSDTILGRQEPQSLNAEEIRLLDEYLTDLAASDSVRAAARARYDYLLDVDQRVGWCLNRPIDWGGGAWWPDSFYEKYFRCIYVLKGYGGERQQDWWVIKERKKEEDEYLAHLKRIEDGKALAQRIAAKLNKRV